MPSMRDSSASVFRGLERELSKHGKYIYIFNMVKNNKVNDDGELGKN